MQDFSNEIDTELSEFTAHIVAAYVSNNHVPRDGLSDLIGDTFRALKVATSKAEEPSQPAPLVPAVPVKKSVQPDHIVCLEDGKTFKSLKRHLMKHHGLTPNAYRQKWGLPAEYPMVAPSYSEVRSKSAISRGFGRKRATASEPMAVPTPEPSAIPTPDAPKRRSSRKAAAPAEVAPKQPPRRGRPKKAERETPSSS